MGRGKGGENNQQHNNQQQSSSKGRGQNNRNNASSLNANVNASNILQQPTASKVTNTPVTTPILASAWGAKNPPPSSSATKPTLAAPPIKSENVKTEFLNTTVTPNIIQQPTASKVTEIPVTTPKANNPILGSAWGAKSPPPSIPSTNPAQAAADAKTEFLSTTLTPNIIHQPTADIPATTPKPNNPKPASAWSAKDIDTYRYIFLNKIFFT